MIYGSYLPNDAPIPGTSFLIAGVDTVVALLAGVAGRRSRTAAAVGGVAAVAGSALTRFGIFHAGVASAEDPKHTVVPQRQRLDERAGVTAGV